MPFLFLSTVTAVGQTAKPLFEKLHSNDWEESGEVFQQILPVDDHWWKSFKTPNWTLIALRQQIVIIPIAMAINRGSAARARSLG